MMVVHALELDKTHGVCVETIIFLYKSIQPEVMTL